MRRRGESEIYRYREEVVGFQRQRREGCGYKLRNIRIFRVGRERRFLFGVFGGLGLFIRRFYILVFRVGGEGVFVGLSRSVFGYQLLYYRIYIFFQNGGFRMWKWCSEGFFCYLVFSIGFEDIQLVFNKFGLVGLSLFVWSVLGGGRF